MEREVADVNRRVLLTVLEDVEAVTWITKQLHFIEHCNAVVGVITVALCDVRRLFSPHTT